MSPEQDRKSFETLLQPEAQKMLANFSSLLNVRLGYFTPDGIEVCVGGGRPICTYCRTMRLQCGFDHVCFRLDSKMFAKARRAKHPFSYPCHAGLTEAFIPVDLADRRVGLLMVGQFRKEGQVPPPVTDEWEVPREEVEELYKSVPIFSEQQVEDMLSVLELMVEAITDRHLTHRSEIDLTQPLLDRIHANPAETLSVDEAAAMLGRSPSSLAHLFKDLTGQSVRQYQISRKLFEADRLLHTFPSMPIKEVAHRLGFDDPLYFSRFYRKNRGVPPSSSRERRYETE